MSVTKAVDVAFVRFRAPDLERMRRFLRDFGMLEAVPSWSGETALYMRGGRGGPYVHVTERGEPGFVSFGIWLADVDDLRRLAEHEGAAIEPLDAPGGGFRVRLTDPDGFIVEAVAGQEMAPLIESPVSAPWNNIGERQRVAAFRRVPSGSSHVQRLGHVVLAVRDFRTSERWYKERFGLLTSDEIQPEPGIGVGAFLRCDRGDDPCDHHTIFLLQRPDAPVFMHAAFEVRDLDDLMAGHDHLKKKGYEQLWGVGRHVLGSQVFDYWLDPWGHEIEHWTDGDQLRASDGGGVASVQELMGVQWGMPMPPLPGAPQ